MRTRNKTYTSSQQSPNIYLGRNYKYKQSLYGHMFLEDFCRSFSIEFSPFDRDDDFYDVKPTNDRLKQYLLFEDFHFFRYEFEKILDAIMYPLLLKGKAYIEIVIWKDSENNPKGISFVPLNVLKSKRGIDKFVFLANQHDSKPIRFDVKEKNLIIFDLKHMGIHRGYFRRIINKMVSLDLPELLMDMNSSKTGFDFNEYTRKRDLNTLKINSKSFWLGRNYGNPHLSESYLLYRIANYKMLRLKFLDYILKQINLALQRFSTELCFSGEIAIAGQRIEYQKHLDSLQRGEINTSQLSKLIQQ